MLKVVKSFHVRMQTTVRVEASVSDRFEVSNGFRKGCTFSPTLFNLYRTAKSRLSVARVTESKFADDVAFYTTSHGNLESVAGSFVGKAGDWDLIVSIEKTKGMATGDNLSEEETAPVHEEEIAPVQVEGGEIEMVDHFTHLG